MTRLRNTFPKPRPAWKPVTVRHLLTTPAGSPIIRKTSISARTTAKHDLLKIVAGIPLAFPPGTKWSYSNLGYLTLGVLIHRVTGKFYGDVLQERIFRPLGMQTTRIMSEADIIPNRASGYRLVKGELKNQEWVSPTLNTTADGSLYFSILDLAKWDAALYTEKLLKRSSLEQMWTVGQAQRRPTEFRSLRIWLGDNQFARTSAHRSRGRMARIQDPDFPLRG